ncbi:MAG: hypothetical protein EAX81_07215 [Candidatus Thorarchaeota archaeon]|nr:hypothetical protein [Candidatus Thorarchaeota archaeon]
MREETLVQKARMKERKFEGRSMERLLDNWCRLVVLDSSTAVVTLDPNLNMSEDIMIRMTRSLKTTLSLLNVNDFGLA